MKALEKYEVGHFRDLRARPNPGGFVIYPVPSFENVFQIVQQQLGHSLTESEMEEARGNAACIVLPEKEAQAMDQERASTG